MRDVVNQLATAKRILVLGPSGAGKTRLSLRIGQLLGIETVHLDGHFWKPGWVPTPQSVWRKKVAGLVQTEAWIMDGTYESTLDLRIPRADAIILLNETRFLRLYRILIRRFGGGDKTRPDAPPGQKLDLGYLRYIFRFSKTAGPIIAKQLSQHGTGKVLVNLSGQRDIDNLLRQIETSIYKKIEKS